MFDNKQPQVDLSPHVSDEVKTTTCYMCACRCGINVHLQGDQIRYIEGNKNHPVNKGVLCAKGSAGIMQHNSPARLNTPLLRVGERGSGEFKKIKWSQALQIACEWLKEVREKDPKKLAFFTGRDQSQSFTSWWAKQFGTFNYAAHGGFCSVNMATAGLYTIGGSFWEFGEPDWEHTRYFLMFGVAEDHDSNPIKMGLGKLKARKNTKFVSINPVRTGYSAIADEWIAITPGTDGLLVMSLIYELLHADRIDHDFIKRYTNLTWLVIQNPDKENNGLFARDEQGKALIYNSKTQKIEAEAGINESASLSTGHTLPNGLKVVTAMQLLVEQCFDKKYAPQNAAKITGVPAATIRRIAAELAEAAFESNFELPVEWTDIKGNKHKSMKARPVSMHAMRGISAHSNGFQTCRAIHLLQILLGTIDCPGGFRYKPPFPKHCPPTPKPGGKSFAPLQTLDAMPLGFVTQPEDLLVDENAKPMRIDKAFSWEFPFASHGMMHSVIHNAADCDPYDIKVLFMYMANMAWNSSMNVSTTLEALTRKKSNGEYVIPKIIYSDAYHSETVNYADLILPDTTYLERWDCISLLDRPISSADAIADAIRQPVIKPKRDVRPFQDVMLEIGYMLEMPGFINDKKKPLYPGGYADYITNHRRGRNLSPLAGWRGDDGDEKNQSKGKVKQNQLQKYIENGCFWTYEFEDEQKYFKFANKSYLELAKKFGFINKTEAIVMHAYCEPLQKFRLAALGFGDKKPPMKDRDRIEKYFKPLPFWYEPLDKQNKDKYSLHAITQRPMHMYHSWGSQNAWLRQITNQNYLFVHTETANQFGLKNHDWAWVESRTSKIRVQIQCTNAVEKNTVWTWNAIGKRSNVWGLHKDAPESKKGFILNHIIDDLLPEKKDGYRYSNADPVTGQAAWYDLKVTLKKCNDSKNQHTYPLFPSASSNNYVKTKDETMRYGKDFNRYDKTRNTCEAVKNKIKSWIGGKGFVDD